MIMLKHYISVKIILYLYENYLTLLRSIRPAIYYVPRTSQNNSKDQRKRFEPRLLLYY